MAKDKAEMMKKLREERKAQGLKELRIYAKPDHHPIIKDFAESLNEQEEDQYP